MVQENVAAWRATIDELRTAGAELAERHGCLRMSEFWDPDMEFDTSEAPESNWTGTYLGRDAIRSCGESGSTALETFEFDCELVEAGNRVVTLTEWRPRVHFSRADPLVWQNAWVSTSRTD